MILKTYAIPAILLLIFCSVFVFFTTPYNLGISHDSVFYIEAAENFSAGNGIIDDNGKLVNHWPPVYSIVLGISSLLTGLEVISLGIGLNIFLIILFGILFFFILKELGLNLIVSNLMLLLLLTGLPLTVYRCFWSEGLFFVFLLTTLYLIISWAKKKELNLVLLAGLISGLFFLTRYAGIGFIGGFSLYILLYKNTLKNKIKALAAYLVPTIVVFFIWYFYTKSFGQPSINRKFIFHLVEIAKIKAGLLSIFSWFINDVYLYFSASLIFIIGVFYIIKIKLNYDSFKLYFRKHRSIVSLLFTLIAIYPFFLLFSISFFDPTTPLNTRILAPLYPLILIITGVLVNFFFELNYKDISYLLIFILVFNSAASSFTVWKSHFKRGLGYNSKAYQQSDILKVVPQNSDLILFSNETSALRFYSKSKTKHLPRKFINRQLEKNIKLPERIQELKNLLDKAKGQIVYFNTLNDGHFMTKEELLNEFTDYKIKHYEKGVIISK